MKKSALVLGGGGFIGANIARELMNRSGYDVTIADRSVDSRLNSLFDEEERQSLTVIKADFSRPEAYNLLARRYDQVYMMAAIVGVNHTLKHPDDVVRTNTALIHYTLEWLARAEVGRIVFASSSENYAASTDIFGASIPTPESVPLAISDIKHPRWTYAITKILGEAAFLHTAPVSGFQATVVRYQNAFGPDMGFRHVIPHLVQRFWEREHYVDTPFQIYGAEQTRAFCYISDAVDGTIRAMETPVASGEVYHIGNDEEITIEALTRAVGDFMGYAGPYEHAITYPGSVERRCPDISKCRSDLRFEPQVQWKEGVRRTVEWYREFFASGGRPADVGFEPPEKVAR
jgi:UDP-glucose 4-epimerase